MKFKSFEQKLLKNFTSECSSVVTQSNSCNLAKSINLDWGEGGVESGKKCETFAQAHMS